MKKIFITFMAAVLVDIQSMHLVGHGASQQYFRC